jgi:hypothetical protein
MFNRLKYHFSYKYIFTFGIAGDACGMVCRAGSKGSRRAAGRGRPLFTGGMRQAA